MMAAPPISLRAAYAKYILNKHLLAKLNNVSNKELSTLPKLPEVPDNAKGEGPYQGRVCIIGAGAAGLYTAMMLKYLGVTNVDILEGNNRVGGRCYTYAFSGDQEYHNYYDVGAMRIPEIPWMDP